MAVYDPENKIKYTELAPSLQKTIDDKALQVDLLAHVGYGGETQHPVVTEELPGFMDSVMYAQLVDIIQNGTGSNNNTSGGTGNGMLKKIFLKSGTFTVPSGITELSLVVIGGGGGSGYSQWIDYAVGGGESSGSNGGYWSPGYSGGHGGEIYNVKISGLSEGMEIPVIVGAGGPGLGWTSGYADAGTGGTSSFGSYVRATGGTGAHKAPHSGSHAGTKGTVITDGTTEGTAVPDGTEDSIIISVDYGLGGIAPSAASGSKAGNQGIVIVSWNAPSADDGVSTGGLFTKGMIMEWSGTVASIPLNWHLCDGTNGTPDMRGKFVIGAGGAYAPGATGGEASHTLTIAEMPNHSHGGGGSGVVYGKPTTNNPWGVGGEDFSSGVDYFGLSGAVGSDPIGGGQPHNNLPPYYALCYIMCIKDATDDGKSDGGKKLYAVPGTYGWTVPAGVSQVWIDMSGGGGGFDTNGGTTTFHNITSLGGNSGSSGGAPGGDGGSKGGSYFGGGSIFGSGGTNGTGGSGFGGGGSVFGDIGGGGAAARKGYGVKVTPGETLVVTVGAGGTSTTGGGGAGSGGFVLIEWFNAGGGQFDIVVNTGTIAGGGIIPLPEGYTEDQCKCIVSYSIPTDLVTNYCGLNCFIDQNTRVVTCLTWTINGEGVTSSVTATANYMIIGTKPAGGTESAVLKGTLGSGGTIPLPEGYTEAQCIWGITGAVSNSGHDPMGAGYITPEIIGCTNGSRVVFAYTFVKGDSQESGSTPDRNIYGSVRYWIRGEK